jgi:DNA gyrase/topoisomerase IV subunit A
VTATAAEFGLRPRANHESSRNDNIRLVIQMKRNADVADVAAKIDKIVSGGFNVALNLVERHVIASDNDQLDFKFTNYNYSAFINDWAKWRIKLEKDMLALLIESIKERIHRQDLLILAAKFAQKLIALIQSKKHKTKDDLHKAIAKLMKISVDDAIMVLQLTIGRLSSLDQEEIKKVKTNLESQLKDARTRIKNPALSAVQVTKDLAKRKAQ